MSDLDLTLFIRRGVEYPRTRYAGELQGEILLKEQMAGHETPQYNQLPIERGSCQKRLNQPDTPPFRAGSLIRQPRPSGVFITSSQNQAAGLIDLQWFAAEDEGRTEEPSEYKIRKAREEGRVAKSQELVGALVLLLPAVAILIMAPYMLRTCVEMLRFFFLRITELDPIHDRLVAGVIFTYFVKLVLPIIAVSVVAAIFANVIQTGFLFTTKPLVPDFSKVVPRFGRYIQRTLFSMEGLFNFVKSIVKMAIIAAVAIVLIRSRWKELLNLQTAGLWLGVSTVASLAIRMMIISAILLLALSVPDMLFQRWQYRESLKMSKQEAKQEQKDMDGDPQIKGRIQRRMRELMNRNIAVNVAKADVVITNPTHFAVALEYHWGMKAPQVTAKGMDEIAQRIKAIARENEVPLVENRLLARALYAEVEVMDLVPEQYFKVISDILASVYRLNEERRKANGIGA
ncbi:flagellar biosynthesis protein FlhB [Spirochaetia bacterium]|nr:flagellar biosynthesis protein FlhB [Spirochaetia bacterium]